MVIRLDALEQPGYPPDSPATRRRRPENGFGSLALQTVGLMKLAPDGSQDSSWPSPRTVTQPDWPVSVDNSVTSADLVSPAGGWAVKLDIWLRGRYPFGTANTHVTTVRLRGAAPRVRLAGLARPLRPRQDAEILMLRHQVAVLLHVDTVLLKRL